MGGQVSYLNRRSVGIAETPKMCNPVAVCSLEVNVSDLTTPQPDLKQGTVLHWNANYDHCVELLKDKTLFNDEIIGDPGTGMVFQDSANTLNCAVHIRVMRTPGKDQNAIFSHTSNDIREAASYLIDACLKTPPAGTVENLSRCIDVDTDWNWTIDVSGRGAFDAIAGKPTQPQQWPGKVEYDGRVYNGRDGTVIS